jgi:hypothetical protein
MRKMMKVEDKAGWPSAGTDGGAGNHASVGIKTRLAAESNGIARSDQAIAPLHLDP